MNNPINSSAAYYSLADFQNLHVKAIENPSVSQGELEAFAYIHTQALVDERAGFYLSEFDDEMAAIVLSYGPPTSGSV